MLQTRFGKTLLGAVVSAAALLGAAGPAQATLYKGAFDPAYGGAFPSLGWKGEVFFDVSAGCIGQAAGWYGVSGTCTGAHMVSGTLSFYDSIADPSGSSPLQTFTLNPSVTMYELYTNGSTLQGVSTGWLSPVNPSLAIAGGGADWFNLKFLKVDPPLGHPSVELVNTVGLHDPSCLSDSPPTCVGGVGKEQATFTFTPVVPEPGTYALMLAGLGVLGFIARRRRH